jgi:UDPglucose 6-dehydrogenase
MCKERIIEMDIRSAELTKYAANAMLACRISFMNEIAKLSEFLSLDIHKIRKGIGSDPRIGPQFLYPGAGFGGSCFPKDLRALIRLTEAEGIKSPLLEAIYEVNEKQKMLIGQKIDTYFQPFGGLQGKQIGIWGLAFKPETDDIREAPAIELVKFLVQNHAVVKLYDPIAMNNFSRLFPASKQIIYCSNEKECAERSDALCLMTEWRQFRFVNMSQILHVMKGRAFFDGRNQYPAVEMKNFGFDYFGIGISSSKNLLQQLQMLIPSSI